LTRQSGHVYLNLAMGVYSSGKGHVKGFKVAKKADKREFQKEHILKIRVAGGRTHIWGGRPAAGRTPVWDFGIGSTAGPHRL